MFSVDLATGQVATLADVFVFEPSFRDGVRVAVGNVGGGGFKDFTAIGDVTNTAARRLGAAAVVARTRSGFTACLVSKFRPPAPIVARCTR